MTDKTPSARELQADWRNLARIIEAGATGSANDYEVCASELEPLCVREERDVELIRRLVDELAKEHSAIYRSADCSICSLLAEARERVKA